MRQGAGDWKRRLIGGPHSTSFHKTTASLVEEFHLSPILVGARYLGSQEQDGKPYTFRFLILLCMGWLAVLTAGLRFSLSELR
jgi:hypothetical protein